MQDFTQHDLDMDVRLTRIESKMDALNQRFDEALATQLKDHGKRLASLERRQVWFGGWVAGAGAMGAALVWLVQRVM